MQAGRRQAVDLACDWVPGLVSFGFQTDHLLNPNYAFDGIDRFAGSDGGNLAILYLRDPDAPNASIAITMETALDRQVLGIFATLPDPLSDPSDVWPDPSGWPNELTVETDAAGAAPFLYVVVKPESPAADVRIRAETATDTIWLLVRSSGVGSLTVGAE